MTTIGIDLGTTNSAVAYVDKHNRPVIINNAEGEPTTPSVICFKEDGSILVGEDAREEQRINSDPTVAFFKSAMGKQNFTISAGSKSYTPEELSTIILAKLKKDAEEFLKETVTDAVITVPAYFRDPERSSTKRAAEKAGFNVLQIINEPTAAAIAYLKDSPLEGRLLIYDLGGGTFDVTLIERKKSESGCFTNLVLATDGDHELGGRNWDEKVLADIQDKFFSEHQVKLIADGEYRPELMMEAEKIKRNLSRQQKTTSSVTSSDGKRLRYELTRDEFAAITRDLLEQTTLRIKKIMQEKELKTSDLRGVLLVGGSTRMPQIREQIGEVLGGVEILTGVNVDEVVALGAALKANEYSIPVPGDLSANVHEYAIPGLSDTIDVTGHCLGVIALKPDNSAYVNSIILPKNRTIPCEDYRPYRYQIGRGQNDRHLEIYLTQGDSLIPDQVCYAGLYRVDNVPGNPGDAVIIDIAYKYDRNGMICVKAKVNGSELPVTKQDNLPEDIPEKFMQPPRITCEVEHITAYLVFDVSVSMTGGPITEAKKAGFGFVDNFDLTSGSIGIMVVANKAITLLKASQNAHEIKAAINRIAVNVEGAGGSNSAHPFDKLLNEFHGVEGKRFALVLADGQWSNQSLAADRAQFCHRSKIDIVGVGFGTADKKFLKAISSTGQEAVFTEMSKLEGVFSSIAQEITKG